MPSIKLTEQQRDNFCNSIQTLLRNWHPDPSRADYRCEFCNEYAKTNDGDVTHKPDCDGVALLDVLWKAEED